MKRHDDPCGAARALSVVGDRWSLLVIRELLLGPKRFTALSRGLPTMSQNMLSSRLRQLEADGLLRQRRLGPPASVQVYELTDRGAALEPVLIALSGWGSRFPLETTTELSVDALMLALKTTFRPERATGIRIRLRLLVGDDVFTAEIADGRFTVARDGREEPDATLAADCRTMRALVFGGRTLASAVAAGDATAEGDRRRIDRFLSCFPRPQPWASEP